MSFDIPDACTLPVAAQAPRLGEFEALFATAVRDVERVAPTHLRLTLTGGQGLEDTVRDLAARESACCSFFDVIITPADEAVLVDIRVPVSQVPVLDGMARLATAGPR